MNKMMLVVIMALAFLAPSVHANPMDDIKDNPGMAIGAGAGAAVGGIHGAVVGAGAGAVVDNVAREVGNFFRSLSF